MTNLIFIIIILALVSYAGYIMIQASEQETSELFSVSDEIVKTIYDSGGTVEQIKQIHGSLELDLAEFEVKFYNAQGNLEERIASQAFDSEGQAIGPIFWDKPINPEEHYGPPSDTDEEKSSGNATG